MTYELLPDANQAKKKTLTYEEALKLIQKNEQTLQPPPIKKDIDFTDVAVNSIILILIMTGLVLWLRKDYKKYKSNKKQWIFFIELVVVVILAVIILNPLLESLLFSLNIS